jgi:hypothetical protein
LEHIAEKGLWDVIGDNPMAVRSDETLESEEYIKRVKEYKKQDQKAKAKFGQRVNKRFSLIVNKAKSAHDALNTLKTFYYSLEPETLDIKNKTAMQRLSAISARRLDIKNKTAMRKKRSQTNEQCHEQEKRK